jgi:hypothetical protein
MIDKIEINERNNFTNENDVFNFVNLLFNHLYYGKDCEIKVLIDRLWFYWDLRRVGSKPDLMVSTDGMIKPFVKQKDKTPLLLKDETLKLDDLKYQTVGEALACAQTNLDSCDARKLDCDYAFICRSTFSTTADMPD